MSKGLSKEELDSDILITIYARLSVFLKENTAAVIAFTVLVLALIGGTVWYTVNSANQSEAAQSFLGYSEQYMTSGDYESALYGTDAILGVGLVSIVENYGRTDAGNLARYYAAVAFKELGDNDTALEYMRNFKAPEGILGVGAISFYAVLLDNAGLHQEAAREFRRAANWDKNEGTTPQNLLRAAQSALQADDYSQADQLAAEIIRDYPNAAQVTQAQRIAGMVAAR